MRGLDLNQRPSGYEPDELPGCSTPRHHVPSIGGDGTLYSTETRRVSRLRDRSNPGEGGPSEVEGGSRGVGEGSGQGIAVQRLQNIVVCSMASCATHVCDMTRPLEAEECQRLGRQAAPQRKIARRSVAPASIAAIAMARIAGNGRCRT